VPEVTAAGFASMFFIGITAGRAANGFLTMRFSDRQLIRAGQTLVGLGALLVLISAGQTLALAGLVVMGIGCAPIYPCIIHMTPDTFGRERSQSMIGVQMGFAYIGFCTMPPLFGKIAEVLTVELLPLYLLLLTAVLAVMHEIVVKKTAKH
jgi:fucose permease